MSVKFCPLTTQDEQLITQALHNLAGTRHHKLLLECFNQHRYNDLKCYARLLTEEFKEFRIARKPFEVIWLVLDHAGVSELQDIELAQS